MRKNSLCLTMATIFCAFALTGCQKVPDATTENNIMHAQGDVEKQVQDIVIVDTQEQTQVKQVVGQYQGIVGTGDNTISINAEVPALPDELYIITLKPNDGLDKNTLLTFLDSESSNIEDTSQELLKEIEESDKYNVTPDETGERVLYSKFGDHSAMRLGDGKKEASFACHTSAYYVDNDLMEKYYGIYSGAYSETLIIQDQMDKGSFSANEAAKILLDKVEAVGVSDIAIKKIHCTEGAGHSFYNIEFVPVYDGIVVDIGSNSYALGQVWPNGYALISEEGVAELSLIDFCGKSVDKKSVTALSFEQVLKILEQYLDSGIIESDGKITYNRVELNYYPVPNPAPVMDEIEYKSELVLTPIWHIYMPLDEYVDGGYGDAVGPSHICVNAVTGELEGAD